MLLKNKHILVVDDDEDDRKLFCKALTQVSEEIGCLRASSGKEALEFLSDRKNSIPELIFLDINMPVMNGWEFLTRIRKDLRLKHIPIIILSTSSSQRDINIAYDLGATSYSVKPDDLEELKSMLKIVAENIDNDLQTALSQGRAYFHLPSI